MEKYSIKMLIRYLFYLSLPKRVFNISSHVVIQLFLLLFPFRTKLVHQGVKFVLNPSILDKVLAHTTWSNISPFESRFPTFCFVYSLTPVAFKRLLVSILFEMFCKFFYVRTAGSDILKEGVNPSIPLI